MNKIVLQFLFLFSSVICWAQTTISGMVVDENLDPVPFVNVVFTNSSEGTVTNRDGYFHLFSAQTQNSAEFSFLGYESQIVPLGRGKFIDMKVVLNEKEQGLEEVYLYRGRTSKKNNPAIDILRKIWENKRRNGVNAFASYEYNKYEKIEFDLKNVDSSLISSNVFKGMEFILKGLDTSAVTGRTYLPVFLNEALMKVYGNNVLDKERQDLLGNRNSGFNDNHMLITVIKDLYFEIDVYENYLRIFDKNFISPLSSTGIDTYNYVLADSAFVDNKWCYNVVYYPRRKNELTFKGNFWVNDTTWAIKKVNMQMAANANLNWVNEVYLEQEFEVLNDSVFLLKRDFIMAAFSFEKNENAQGLYGKRTVVYDDHRFNRPHPPQFYNKKMAAPNASVYNREEEFWQQRRLEPLNRNEEGIYELMDTLQTVSAYKRIQRLAGIAASGYVEFKGWDFGPLYNIISKNEVEGWRIRAGARTYFGQNDPWRIEGYGAYGFGDGKFKYGILGQAMLDPANRLILSLGRREDIEQLGAGLTGVTDVLGRSLASNSLLNVGDNDKLSAITLTTFGLELEPVKNITFKVIGSHRRIEAASQGFSMEWYIDEEREITEAVIEQAEISTIISLTPGRKAAGFGVDRLAVNPENFATIFLNYSVGVEGLFNSDFSYRKVQLFYDQPWWIGGSGLANISMEAGKTFGQVPLGLLSVVPGNQTFFSVYNSFALLNYYEFVTDTYVSTHLEHNFNGKLFSRIPLLRDLNLREIIGLRGVWGQISEENKRLDASGVQLRAPQQGPYYEYSIGVGNLFKFLRIDAHFRGNYKDNPDAREFGLTAAFGFHF